MTLSENAMMASGGDLFELLARITASTNLDTACRLGVC